MISPYADALIVPAQPILDRIARYGSFQRGQVIANGIDVERFAKAQPPSAVPWPAGVKVVGYVGRFDPVKNLPALLRAFAALRGGEREDGGGARLALVGYGLQEEALRRLAISLHIAPRTHFLGATDVPEWYKSFPYSGILPSAVEGFGLTLVEAVAAGVK